MPGLFRREPAPDPAHQPTSASQREAAPDWWDDARRWDDHRTLAALAEWMHEHEWPFSDILHMLYEPWDYERTDMSGALAEASAPAAIRAPHRRYGMSTPAARSIRFTASCLPRVYARESPSHVCSR